MKLLILTCVRCGAQFLRKRRQEYERVRCGKSGPYCSKSCIVQRSAVRSNKEPDPVSGARWLSLTHGKFALVDADRFDELNVHLWRWQRGRSYDNGYAVRSNENNTRKVILLHQDVMRTTSEVEVDHKDRNTLDCRASNLRICTHQQNSSNRRKPPAFAGKPCISKYKGVTRGNRGKPWRAQIRAFKKHYYLGSFATELEAARAYDAAAIQHFGEFARPNFPTESHEHAS